MPFETKHQGEAFRNPKHLYADDLDLLGPASAFELLSTSRTATGDRILAEWLLASGLNVRMQLQLHKYIWDPQARGV